MKLEALQARLAQPGLERIREPLLALAAPCVRIFIQRLDSADDLAFDASPGWRVLHLPGDPATFTRRAFPPDVPLRFPACAASFAAEVTVPEIEEPEFEALGVTNAERNRVIDVLLDPEESVNRGRFADGGHHLLGYASNLPDSGRVAAAEQPGAGQPDAAAIRRWRLLPQVDSSSVAQMDWAGGGMLQWFIEGEALARGDVSRPYLVMAFL